MIIQKSADLITSREETRAGFIEFALEKNRRAKPFIEEAKVFRHYAMRAKMPMDLLKIDEIRKPLLTASGLSDKALQYFTDEDKDVAIKELIRNFLEPAGPDFVEEAVFRYLLIKGDSLGGSMRNIIGALAQQKLIRSLLSVMRIRGIEYSHLAKNSTKWLPQPIDDYGIEDTLHAIHWIANEKDRVLAFNLKIPSVGKNVDLCMFDCHARDYAQGTIVRDNRRMIMLGELKGGIDPAGADEHWKTANTALDRIRTAFSGREKPLLTSFVGAAIERSMADELFTQLNAKTLSFAANLTKEEQIIAYSIWLLSI
jgi:type II restriction enzyme